MRHSISLIILFLFSKILFGQSAFSIRSVPDSLLVNAKEIVINENSKVEVISNKLFKHTYSKTTKIISSDSKRIPFYISYDKNKKIKKVSLKVLNKSGVEIQSFSKKDFNDQSATGSATFVGDNRIKSLVIQTTELPVTTIFEFEIENTNTAFIPEFTPVNDFEESILSSEYIISWPSDLTLYRKENDYAAKYCTKSLLKKELKYKLSNFSAVKEEEFSPPIELFGPKVHFSLSMFRLEGVNADASNWTTLGKWYHTNFLKNQNTLPQSAIVDIQSLTAEVSNEKEKIGLVYEYMQQRSRYISIQLGVGGWKPFSAEQTHHLGYGDCKALTNYTKSLLEVAGINSYFTYLYGERSIAKDIISDYPNLNANHAILCVVPNNKDTVWLECTSSNAPYNYLSDFISDRKVVVIKEDGAYIAKTPKTNFGKINSVYHVKVSPSSLVEIDVKKEYSGGQFDRRGIAELKEEKKINYLKREYGKITQLKIENFNSSLDTGQNSFEEIYSISGSNLIVKNGKMFILPYIPFSDYKESPKKYKERNTPVHVPATIELNDSITYSFDNLSHSIETFEDSITTKFGNYTIAIRPQVKGVTIFRTIKLNKGLYSAEEYSAFHEFLTKIQLLENKKTILTTL